ncbi:response regulator transcription factor [Streptomyces yangpuensis]|uniref:helix-turn-helix transcriptional regulator n=1 Tax=Streptomyces yangpuensis TaxID=1648182 RepID=UPI003817500E
MGAHGEQLVGLSALFEDDLEHAIPCLEEALALYRAVDDQGSAWTTLFLLALACCLAGDPRASALCHEGLNLCEAHQAQWSRSWALWLCGLQHFLLADLEGAVRLLQESLRGGLPSHNRLGVAQCLEVLAWTRARQGRMTKAAELLGAAQGLWRELGTALPGVGRLLHHRTECEALLRRAVTEESLAAGLHAGEALTIDEAVDRALERATARSDGPDGSFAPALTPRELQVAQLICQGLTNKEIAATLVVSPRTAEGHVHRLLVKLGLTSRLQIASWAREHLVRSTA